jgi:hypothetical protein
MDEQNFSWGPGFPRTYKAGMPNLRRVQNHQIAGSDQRRQLRKCRVHHRGRSDRRTATKQADPARQYPRSGKMPPVGRPLPPIVPEQHQ